ncbi:hypothetical protein [Selenomonas ruminantium]|uniref:hypothetical protein n=1 Tax=Selenomonas ruminantium TaxID=971 RepID=UPI000478CE48|nr:hypothetical protein [Selenomonas ruminantium]
MSKWNMADRPYESREYLQGWSIAGKQLQTLFNKYNEGILNVYQGFCWIRTQIISPTFDSMNFRYKNRVYSVLVDLVTEGESSLLGNLRPYQESAFNRKGTGKQQYMCHVSDEHVRFLMEQAKKHQRKGKVLEVINRVYRQAGDEVEVEGEHRGLMPKLSQAHARAQ